MDHWYEVNCIWSIRVGSDDLEWPWMAGRYEPSFSDGSLHVRSCRLTQNDQITHVERRVSRGSAMPIIPGAEPKRSEIFGPYVRHMIWSRTTKFGQYHMRGRMCFQWSATPSIPRQRGPSVFKLFWTTQSNFLHINYMGENPPTRANRPPTPGISPKWVNRLFLELW